MRAVAVTTRCTTQPHLPTYRRDESLRTTDTSLSTSSRVL
jgi:hypothetical protein